MQQWVSASRVRRACCRGFPDAESEKSRWSHRHTDAPLEVGSEPPAPILWREIQVILAWAWAAFRTLWTEAGGALREVKGGVGEPLPDPMYKATHGGELSGHWNRGHAQRSTVPKEAPEIGCTRALCSQPSDSFRVRLRTARGFLTMRRQAPHEAAPRASPESPAEVAPPSAQAWGIPLAPDKLELDARFQGRRRDSDTVAS